MSINKQIENFDNLTNEEKEQKIRERFLYSEEQLIELTERIRKIIDWVQKMSLGWKSVSPNFKAKNQKNNQKNNNRKVRKISKNSLVWKMVFDNIEKERRDMKKNPYFVSFEKFLDERDEYVVNSIDLENLDVLIEESILRISSAFEIERELFYNWELEIDDNTSFWQDLLILVTMAKIYFNLWEKEKENFLQIVSRLKISNYKNTIDLGYFLEHLYLSEKSWDDTFTVTTKD